MFGMVLATPTATSTFSFIFYTTLLPEIKGSPSTGENRTETTTALSYLGMIEHRSLKAILIMSVQVG